MKPTVLFLLFIFFSGINYAQIIDNNNELHALNLNRTKPVLPEKIYLNNPLFLNINISGTSRQAIAGYNREMLIYKSIDSGVTFSLYSVAVPGSGGPGEDKEWIFCDPVQTNPTYNNIFITWTSFGPIPGIKFRKSSDGGSTWSNSVNVSDNLGGQGSNVSSGTNGDIYVVWADNRINNGDDVWFQRSTDGGLTWLTNPVIINDSITNDQYWPAIQCDTSGHLHVIYYDERTALGVVNAYYAFSKDSGSTWQNIQLSDTSFYGLWPNQDVRFGDYIGIDAYGGNVIPVWTDDRASNYNQEIFTGTPSMYTQISAENIRTPDRTSLFQNFPNPCNKSTTFKFYINKRSFVNLYIYDSFGAVVKKIFNKGFNAGLHTFYCSELNLPHGIYFYNIVCENYSQTRKLIVINE